jgi:hypothetical protein
LSLDGTPKYTQTIIDATQKETAIDQQQHSCETLIYQHHQTILRFLYTAATASTQWRVLELYCRTSYTMSVEQVGGVRIGRGNHSTWRKPASVPFRTPQILHYLTWDRTRSADVRRRRKLRLSVIKEQKSSKLILDNSCQ